MIRLLLNARVVPINQREDIVQQLLRLDMSQCLPFFLGHPYPQLDSWMFFSAFRAAAPFFLHILAGTWALVKMWPLDNTISSFWATRMNKSGRGRTKNFGHLIMVQMGWVVGVMIGLFEWKARILRARDERYIHWNTGETKSLKSLPHRGSHPECGHECLKNEGKMELYRLPTGMKVLKNMVKFDGITCGRWSRQM